MKYIAVFDDEMLKVFRLGDMGLTLIVNDLTGQQVRVTLKMLVKPVVVNKKGESVYITEGHIKALLDYEAEQKFKHCYDETIAEIRKGAKNERERISDAESSHS